MMYICRDCREEAETNQEPCIYCGSNDVVSYSDYYDEPYMGINLESLGEENESY